MIVLVLLFAHVILLAADGQKIIGNFEFDFFSNPGSSLISIALSDSPISMRGIAEAAKPGISRVMPSKSR
jgi:hypothetical protein